MPAPNDNSRYSALDSLRAWMMLLLIPFHAAVPFITIQAPNRFDDPAKHVLFDGFVLLMISFRRPLLFVVGGLFAAMLLHRRGVSGLVHNRFQRIFLPLVVGWLVLSPLTRAAYKFAAAASSQGSTSAGFEALESGSWLQWRNPYHLWFLIALLLFYGVALAVRWALLRFSEARLSALAARSRRFLASPWRPLAFAAVLACAFVPSEFYPPNRGNVFLAAAMALFFALGWILYRNIDLLAAQTRHAWTYVAVGLALLPVATWTKGSGLHAAVDAAPWHLASGLAFSSMAAFLVFGVLGVFVAHGNQRSATMRYLSDSSYWIYLSHMPLVVFVGGALTTTALPALVRFSLTVAVVTTIVLVAYRYGVRYTPIGALLNGPRERPSADDVAAGRAGVPGPT